MSRWLQILLFAMLLGASTALWAGRDRVVAMLSEMSGGQAETAGAKKKRGGRPVPVIVATAEERQDVLSLIAIGNARAQRYVTIRSKIPGEITSMDFKSGERVTAGEVLARLDDRKAQLALKVADTRLADARRTLERSEQLKARNVGSVANVEDAKILVARAELEREQAHEVVEDHLIRAPFTGIAGLSDVETGDRIDTTTQITTLDDRTTLLVEFDVPEKFISRLKAGLKVSGRTPGFEQRAFEGKISHIDSRIDRVARTIKVRAEFANDNDLLRPGMSFAITLSLPGPVYPSVPELAVQWGDGESYVWRVNDTRVERLPVDLVRRLNGTILVSGALRTGDLVVVEGVQRMRDGRAVSFGASKGERGKRR